MTRPTLATSAASIPLARWAGTTLTTAAFGVRPLCYLKSEILVSVPGEDDEEKNVEVAEEDRAQLVLIASDRILNALNEYPVEVWGEALGATVASLFTSKQDAAQIAQEDKDKAAEV